MTKIIVYGSNGAMGKILIELIQDHPDFELVCGVSRTIYGNENYKIVNDLNTINDKADVIIDFSHFSLTDNLLNYCVNTNTPLVIATTGLSEDQEKNIMKSSKQIPIFRSKNFSLGINLIADLIIQAKNILKGFDIEIIEKHHNKKVDAPSGTAYLLADSLNESNEFTYKHGRYGKSEKRDEKEIGIHSIRGGTIIGEHSVIFAGTDEVIEFKHSAQSKKVFALGSLEAAKFIKDKKPNLYTMNNLISKE